MELEYLVTLLRSRSAPLPAFATEEFLSKAIHIVPRDTRLMHDDREWIRKATGYPWPEERPTVDDMPRLYVEALRYPAFAIVFQHQFFPDDDNRGGRGLPMNQIIVKNNDAWKRVRKMGPIPKGVSGVPFLRILHCVQNGCEKAPQLAEALGLPGHDAWSARCSAATDGLEKLEAEGGDWAELAKYLRAVFGPFRQFGPDRTIGEIMEEVVIPQAMKQVQVEAARTVQSTDPASSMPQAEVPIEEAGEASREPVDDLSAIEDAWRSECERLMALAGAVSSIGPQGAGDSIDAIKASSSVLEDLRGRAARLVPANYRRLSCTLTSNV